MPATKTKRGRPRKVLTDITSDSADNMSERDNKLKKDDDEGQETEQKQGEQGGNPIENEEEKLASSSSTSATVCDEVEKDEGEKVTLPPITTTTAAEEKAEQSKPTEEKAEPSKPVEKKAEPSKPEEELTPVNEKEQQKLQAQAKSVFNDRAKVAAQFDLILVKMQKYRDHFHTQVDVARKLASTEKAKKKGGGRRRKAVKDDTTATAPKVIRKSSRTLAAAVPADSDSKSMVVAVEKCPSMDGNTSTEPDAKTKRGGRPRRAAAAKAEEKMDADVPVKRASPTSTQESVPTDEEVEDDGEGNTMSEILKPPKYLTGGELRDYQVEGVNWMNSLYLTGVNGILADEMGLGKTVQAIGMIAHLYEYTSNDYPYLIVAPMSTLKNWCREFERFTPKIPVIMYHGSIEHRMSLRKQFGRKHLIDGKKACPVIITTYETVVRDIDHLTRYHFAYFVLDEGHRIKNHQCQLIMCLKRLSLASRMLMTGTPLQNNLTELWSLLSFLMPEVLGPLDIFLSFFDFNEVLGQDVGVPLTTYRKAAKKSMGAPPPSIIKEEQENRMVSRLRDVLDSFLLRRMKKDVKLNLPPKCEVLVYAPMSSTQAAWYKGFVEGVLEEMGHNAKKDFQPFVNETNILEEKRERRLRWTQQEYNDWEKDLDLKEMWNEPSNDEDDKQMLIDKKAAKNIIGDRFYYNKESMGSTLVTLRKITMHPHLLRCPLDEEGLRALDDRLVFDSGKMRLLDQMLCELKKRGHKVLIFTQYVKMLYIIGSYCDWRKHEWRSICGNMQLDERDEQMMNFNHDVDVFCMVVSTRAGGLGLNLVAADTVIIYDSDWNPQADLQAQDRCHRIGQTRPVVVYRLACRGTIDQRMIERATNKRRIEKLVIGGNDRLAHAMKAPEESGRSMSKDELLKLLSSTDWSVVESATDVESDTAPVLTETQLNRLMDRSMMMQTVVEGGDDDQKQTSEDKQHGEVFEVMTVEREGQ